MNAQRRAWFDEPLPALDGRTAAPAGVADAFDRARQGQVRQLISNHRDGRTDDINVPFATGPLRSIFAATALVPMRMLRIPKAGWKRRR